MRSKVQIGFVWLFSLLASGSGATAQSQPAARCPEGKTLAGECVNPAVGAGLRQGAIIFSQPKLSYTAYPILPSADRLYRYPNQLNPDPLLPAPTGIVNPSP
jgi:hypothetical protein